MMGTVAAIIGLVAIVAIVVGLLVLDPSLLSATTPFTVNINNSADVTPVSYSAQIYDPSGASVWGPMNGTTESNVVAWKVPRGLFSQAGNYHFGCVATAQDSSSGEYFYGRVDMDCINTYWADGKAAVFSIDLEEQTTWFNVTVTSPIDAYGQWLVSEGGVSCAIYDNTSAEVWGPANVAVDFAPNGVGHVSVPVPSMLFPDTSAQYSAGVSFTGSSSLTGQDFSGYADGTAVASYWTAGQANPINLTINASALSTLFITTVSVPNGVHGSGTFSAQLYDNDGGTVGGPINGVIPSFSGSTVIYLFVPKKEFAASGNNQFGITVWVKNPDTNALYSGHVGAATLGTYWAAGNAGRFNIVLT